MIIYVTTALPTILRFKDKRIARLYTPKMPNGNLEGTLKAGVKVAADNDGYRGVNVPMFEGMLRYLEPEARRIDFVNAPDTLGSARRTLRQFRTWEPRLRDRGFKVALVAQDGLTHDQIPWKDVDTIFVGGSTPYKLGPEVRAIIHKAVKLGKGRHMGRVNTPKRALYAQEIGCTSIDGSSFGRFPNKYLPPVLEALTLGHIPQQVKP